MSKEHSHHICVDELIDEIKHQLIFIETQWDEKEIDCELITNIQISPDEIGFLISGPDLDLEDIRDLIIAIADKVEQIDETTIRKVKQ